MDKKIIYTITLHHAHNFGAMLQAYALQNYIKNQEVETQIINYDLIHPHIFVPICFDCTKKFFQSLATNVDALRFFGQWMHAYNKFEEFYKEYLVKTQKFTDYSALEKADFSGSAIMVGSDQVWNLADVNDNSKIALLEFTEKVLKCSYAVSLGNNMPEDPVLKYQLLTNLSKYYAVSVRERAAVDYLKENNIVAFQHIDPVFLLKVCEWKKLSQKVPRKISEPYILCYDLVKCGSSQVILDRLKKRYGCKTIVITRRLHTNLKADKIIRDAGPLEFLNLLFNAEHIVTTSFHGTAFSILFKRNFYSLITEHSPLRIIELLEKFQLSSQLVNGDSELPIADFSFVDEVIERNHVRTSTYISDIIRKI